MEKESNESEIIININDVDKIKIVNDENDTDTIINNINIFWEYMDAQDTYNFEGSEKLYDKMNEVFNKLPSKEMIIYGYWFRFGFDFWYGITDDKKYIKIHPRDGNLIRYFNKHNNVWKWLLEDEEGKYFVVSIKEYKSIPPPSGSMPTDQYIGDLLRYRVCSDNFMKLRMLEPYSKIIAKNYPLIYEGIINVIPNFPKHKYIKKEYEKECNIM